MIHEIGRELEAKLEAQKVPFRVVDGPEPDKTTTFARERIVIEDDLEGKDTFETPRSQSHNPDRRYSCFWAGKITVYAQSPRPGAAVFEHRRRARAVVDAVLCALDEIAIVRKNRWAPTGGGFTTPEDLEKSETPRGAVYVLRFQFDRGVAKRTWKGEIAPTGTLTGGLKSSTKVSLNGQDDDGDPTTTPAAAETACGGG